MFKKIYRALVVARAGSAAAHVICNIIDRQLAEAGIDRGTFPLDTMKRMEAEFAAKDAEQTTTVFFENSNVVLQAARCSQDDQIPLDFGSVGSTALIYLMPNNLSKAPMCYTAHAPTPVISLLRR